MRGRGEAFSVVIIREGEKVSLCSMRNILPGGHCVDSPVQPFPQKYFVSSPGRNTFKPHAIPPSQEGRIAIVTDVGCGMRWTRRCHETNETAADGEAVWS